LPACQRRLRRRKEAGLAPRAVPSVHGQRAVPQMIATWMGFWEAAIFVSGTAVTAFLGGRHIALTQMARRRSAVLYG